jgi:hypothetical protein
MKLARQVLAIHKDLEEKEYDVKYVLKTPPKYAEKYPDIWKEAFADYLSRQGVDVNKISKVDNIEWNEVVRIFNTLLGIKNKKRRPDFVRGQKNKDLKAEATSFTQKGYDDLKKRELDKQTEPADLRKLLSRFGVEKTGRGTFKLKKKPDAEEFERALKTQLGKDYARQSNDLWPSKHDGFYYFDYHAMGNSDLYFAYYDPETGDVGVSE